MAKRTRSVGPDATEVLGALHAIGMIVDSLKERLLIPVNGLDASHTELETPRRGKRGPYKRRTKKRRPMTEAEKKRLSKRMVESWQRRKSER